MLRRLVITALKDEAHVLGLVLQCGIKLDLDVADDQMESIQKSVDSGDVEVEGLSKKAAPAPAHAPAPEKKSKEK